MSEMDGMKMGLLWSLILDAALAAAGLAKRRGKLWLIRFAALSVIVNLNAFYLSAGLTAEFGEAAFLTAACVAAAKIFVVWIFVQKEKPADEMLPVYQLCMAVSLCIHINPATGLACVLALLAFCLYTEHMGRERQRREAECGGKKAGMEEEGGQSLYLQAIEDSYRKNRALMHDLNNHAIAMRALADNGEYGNLVLDALLVKLLCGLYQRDSGRIIP